VAARRPFDAHDRGEVDAVEREAASRALVARKPPTGRGLIAGEEFRHFLEIA
jgi:hypothetical protein